MYYHERLKELNNLEGKTIWDSIDRPMRPLIFELNRVGLATKFCCCGFSYDGEEEPKTHAKMTFVVLCPINPLAVNAFFSLAKAAAAFGWMFTPYSQSGEWHLHHKHSDDFYDRKPDQVGIHDYEIPLIKILQLTNCIKDWPALKDEFVIVDGNTHYEALGGEWQVKPKAHLGFKEKEKEVNESKTGSS